MNKAKHTRCDNCEYTEGLEEGIKIGMRESTSTPNNEEAIKLLDGVIDILNDDRSYFNTWMQLTKIKSLLERNNGGLNENK